MTMPGYSNELYDTIAGFGVHRGASILDVAVNGADAAQPFAENGFPVTQVSAASDADLKLSFPDERFDVVLCAQSIHRLPRPGTLNEMTRVLKKSGVIAVWWKQIMAQEGMRELRDQAYQQAKLDLPAEGLSGGFQEFYASDVLRDQIVRVLPWRLIITAEDFVASEDPQVQARLRSLIATRTGRENANVEIGYSQYLYLAKKL